MHLVIDAMYTVVFFFTVASAPSTLFPGGPNSKKSKPPPKPPTFRVDLRVFPQTAAVDSSRPEVYLKIFAVLCVKQVQ